MPSPRDLLEEEHRRAEAFEDEIRRRMRALLGEIARDFGGALERQAAEFERRVGASLTVAERGFRLSRSQLSHEAFGSLARGRRNG